MNSRDEYGLKFMLVMYAALFVPMPMMAYVFHIIGPGHSVEWNSTIFQVSLYSVLWTMLLFVFSGVARARK